MAACVAECSRGPTSHEAEFPVHEWHMSGLGPARGFGGRLLSGHVFEVQELQHAIQYHGVKGPTLFVDAGDPEAQGVQALLAEMVETLRLSDSDLIWILDRAGEQQAARLLRELGARSDRSKNG
jgi:hypothetical protein